MFLVGQGRGKDTQAAPAAATPPPRPSRECLLHLHAATLCGQPASRCAAKCYYSHHIGRVSSSTAADSGLAPGWCLAALQHGGWRPRCRAEDCASGLLTPWNGGQRKEQVAWRKARAGRGVPIRSTTGPGFGVHAASPWWFIARAGHWRVHTAKCSTSSSLPASRIGSLSLIAVQSTVGVDGVWLTR